MTDLIIGLIIGIVGTIITMGFGFIGGIYISYKLQHGENFLFLKTKQQLSPWKKIQTKTDSRQNHTKSRGNISKSAIFSKTKSINT